tara:strand:- start:69 stop:1805 length:1737 start_codon:yes stop_codon:yes gene_type:complete
MVSNEVFVGAGTMATLVPEMDMYFDSMDVVVNTAKNIAVLDSTDSGKYKFLTDLYVGCRAKVTNIAAKVHFVTVVSNDANSFTFDSDVTEKAADTTDIVDVKLLGFGAPVIAPSTTNKKLLSDNWLGLVNTFSPPSVDVETKQLALMGGNTRNLSYQYKGAETVSGGSLDISMNNGSWLYYALGKVSSLDATNTHAWTTTTSDRFIANPSSIGLVRVPSTDGIEYPPLPTSAADTAELTQTIVVGNVTTLATAYTNGGLALVLADATSFGATGTGTINGVAFSWTGKSSNTLTVATLGVDYATGVEVIDNGSTTGLALSYDTIESDSVLTYTFGESNGASLPSFGLDVSYRKAGVAATTAVDNLTPHENMYSRIFTGCQVNTLTLNFEEGQELKTSLDLVTRRAYDVVTAAADNYIPHNGVLTPSGLKNFSATALDNNPFMFSDGALKVFGQTYARVKSGSITINNNITPQRFIGNTSRQVMNEHIPAQRTYEVSMVVLITDTTLWDELRKETESTGDIELHFSKSDDNFIKLALRDYVIQTVDIPFPEDKGAIEATFTASARTLVNAQYKGKWALMH